MQQMLIVEDERDIADCLEQFFSAKGFTVASAFSAEEALEGLKTRAPDVILLDILLPGLSGLELLKRAKVLHPTARIIMVTALDQDELRREAYFLGAAAYVTKPFDFSDHTWSAAL